MGYQPNQKQQGENRCHINASKRARPVQHLLLHLQSGLHHSLEQLIKLDLATAGQRGANERGGRTREESHLVSTHDREQFSSTPRISPATIEL